MYFTVPPSVGVASKTNEHDPKGQVSPDRESRLQLPCVRQDRPEGLHVLRLLVVGDAQVERVPPPGETAYVDPDLAVRPAGLDLDVVDPRHDRAGIDAGAGV